MQIVVERAFEAIVGAMVRAAKECPFSVAFAEAERNGLIEQGDGKPSQLHVWLRFQWRTPALRMPERHRRCGAARFSGDSNLFNGRVSAGGS